MIQCPHCNAAYLEGTLFCEACGAALSIDLLVNEKQTDPLRSERSERSEPDQWRARGATGPMGEAGVPGGPPDLAEHYLGRRESRPRRRRRDDEP